MRRNSRTTRARTPGRTRSRSLPNRRTRSVPRAPRTRTPVRARVDQIPTAQRVFDDIGQTLQILVKDPVFLVLMALSTFLIISHAGSIDHGPLAPLFPADSKNAFVIWVRANVPKFFGAITFAPALYETPLKYRYFSFIAVPLWIYVAPPCKQEQYVIQAILYYLFMKVKLDQSRFALMAASALFYTFGLLFDPFVKTIPAGAGTIPGVTPTTPTPAKV